MQMAWNETLNANCTQGQLIITDKTVSIKPLSGPRQSSHWSIHSSSLASVHVTGYGSVCQVYFLTRDGRTLVADRLSVSDGQRIAQIFGSIAHVGGTLETPGQSTTSQTLPSAPSQTASTWQNTPTIPSTSTLPTPPARLGGWLLLSLVIGYLVSIWFIVIDPGDGNGNGGALGTIGVLLFLIVFIATLALDFRGFVSLNGAIHWRTLSGGKRFWLVLLFVFFFEILLGVYLVRAVVGYYQLTQRRPSDHIQAARSWYVTRSRGVQAGLAAGTLMALITFCSVHRLTFCP